MARWGVLCLLFACSESLPEARFDRSEVIGTRRTITVERRGDSERDRFVLSPYCEPTPLNFLTDRISPRPGETLRMEWLTAAPFRVEPASWSFIVCEPDGLACAGPPLLVVNQPTPSEAPIVFDVSIPMDFAGNRLTVLGAVCFGGPAVNELGEEIYDACQGEGDGSLLFATISMDVPDTGTPNTQPVIDSVLLNGQALSEEVLVAGGPCSDTLPTVQVGEPAEVQVWLSDCSVDVRFDRRGDILTESPSAYAYPSEGILPEPRLFVFAEPGPSLDPEWLWVRAALDLDTVPSEAVPPEGRALSLVVVVNDGYGGDDVRRVGICLRP